MRIDVPGGAWIELRSADELTGADGDAWDGVFSAIYAEAAQDEANEDDGDGMEVSADGASMKPAKRKIKVPANIVQRQRDALLAGVVTGWSYSDPSSVPCVALPYSAECRKVLPLAACKVLDRAILPHIAALKDDGPKETTAPSGTSGNGSGGESPNGLPDSTGEPPATA